MTIDERGACKRPARLNALKYDPADYVREWLEWAARGQKASDFISRSNPGREWFTRNVRPVVHDAVCECGRHFSPAETRLLTLCSKSCGRRGSGRPAVEVPALKVPAVL